MSLDPERHNFKVWAGATFKTVLELALDDAGTQIWDLSGYTARMAINTDQGLVELTTENGGITINGPAGTISLYMSDEDTQAALWVTSNYRLYLTDPSGDSDVLIYGNFTIVR